MGLRTHVDEKPRYVWIARLAPNLGSPGCEAVRPGEVFFQCPEGAEPELWQERKCSAEFGCRLRVGATPARPLIGMRQCGNTPHSGFDFLAHTTVPRIPHADNVHGPRRSQPWECIRMAQSYKYPGAASRPKYSSRVAMPRACISPAASTPT